MRVRLALGSADMFRDGRNNLAAGRSSVGPADLPDPDRAPAEARRHRSVSSEPAQERSSFLWPMTDSGKIALSEG
jgi:hypothetical protein